LISSHISGLEMNSRPFELATPQKGLWAAALLNPTSNACVTGQYSDIRGELNVAAFERASRRVIAETEALRLRFGGSFEQPLQWIVPPGDWSLPVVDLSEESDPHRAALAWMNAQHRRPLDVTVAFKTFHWTLLRLGAQRFIWSFQVHHLVMDGYSRNAIWRRLGQVYSALAAEQEVPPGESGSLRQLFEEEHDYTCSTDYAAHKRYFARLLESLPARVSLSRKPAVTSREFRRVSVYLPSAMTADLRARRSGASLVQAITSAAALLLRGESADDDILLGFAVGARVGDLARRTPSMLSNVVPLRMSLPPQISVEECLRRSGSAMREVMPHQRYPSQLLRQDLRLSPPEPDVYSLVVNFMPFDQGSHFGGYPASTHNLSNGPTADLVIGVVDDRARTDLRIDLNGNRELYDDAALRGHLDRLITLLKAVSQNPGTRSVESVLATQRSLAECFWNDERCDLEVPHLPAPLEPCPAGEEHDWLRISRSLPPALAAQLLATAVEWRSTPFHLFLAAYLAVLRIYTQADEQIIAAHVPQGVLPPDDVEENPNRTLVVSLRVVPASTYRQTVVELMRCFREFHSRVRTSQPSPDVADSPQPFLFSLLDEGAAVALEFQRGVLDPLMAERFLDHCTTLMRAGMEAPETRLSELSVLSPVERDAIAKWGINPQPFPKGRTVTDLFEELARAQPEATALVADSLRLTYQELDQRANAVAWTLHRLGVASGAYLPLLIPRGVDFVVCALGALKIGAAYVPIDPDFPVARRERLLGSLGARVGLCTGSAPLGDAITWAAVNEDQQLAAAPPPRSSVSAEDPAYVMFTSGSTGIPKGVRVAHRGIVRLVRGQDFISLGSNEVWLQLAPTSFDASTLELWAPLLNGGRCILVKAGVPSPELLEALIAQEGVTSAWFTASLFNAIIEEKPGCLAGLGQILVGGEALSPVHVRRAIEHLPRSRLINGYGPTENTTFTCCHRIEPADLENGRSVPIGCPIANTSVRVLDRDGKEAPIGVPGELVVGGDGVALGYVGEDNSTPGRFSTDPVAAEPGALCYRTGDRVRWRSEGVLEFLGRFDDQLKINGHRIEPGEIAAVLTEHPAVRQAVVVPQRAPSGDMQLFAYVVPRSSPPPVDLFAQLGRHVATCLPAYMRLSGFSEIAALPLKANGKLDVRSLPAIAPSLAIPVRPTVAGHSGDAAVLALMSELLGHPVSRADNLYALGANSLRLVRLVARLKSRLGLDLPIGEVSKRGDVVDVLSLVAQQSTASVPKPLRTLFATSSLPACSPWQTIFWRAQQLDPTDASSVVFRAYRAVGPLDIDRLELALRALGARHEALRCRFMGAADADPVLDLRPAKEFLIRRADPLGTALLPDARARARAVPFDLRHELPIRITVQPDADRPGESELWVCVHHIAFDGASEEIFWRELQVIFMNLEAGRAALVGLPPLHSSFIELAQRQRADLDPGTLRARESYWQVKLADVPDRLSLSWRPASVNSNQARQLRRPLATGMSGALRQLGRSQRMSLAMLSLACFQALLWRWSGASDQVIALDFEGRGEEVEEDQIGLFTSPVALRANVSHEMTLLDLARSNRALLGDALSHRIPFERLVAALGEGRRRVAGFPIFFGHLSRSGPPTLGTTPLVELALDTTQTPRDLRVNVEERGDSLCVVVVGAVASFDLEDLERMADALEGCVAQLCRSPDIKLSELEWLSVADRTRIAGWNATGSDYVRDQSLTTLLRAQAGRTPMAIAFEAGDLRLTYADLFERAERLAARLRYIGVGRNARVGLYLDRHSTLPECMLAILDAGGGYVPLDPTFPRDRLTFMLRDAEVCAIVTRRALLPELPPHTAQVICVDDDAPVGPAAAGWLPADASSLAYVLYTSGSTGTPKGVEVEHRQLINFLTSMALSPGMSASDSLLAVTSMSFDIAGLEIWLPLFCGARICLAGREEVADVSLLQQALVRGRVTVLQGTTSIWRTLLASGWSGGEGFKALVGGEALPADLAELLASQCGEAWNLYGPTETTIWSSAWRLPKPVGMVRVGQPIANTELHVLDEWLKPLPVGVTGELFIGGEGVSRGYLNRPDLTAQRFLPDPFRGGNFRMYRTGDLARWLPDGTLNLLGRTDGQLKVRGHRIEAGEVEAALLGLPGVIRAAAVLHKPADQDDARLIAYLVLAGAQRLAPGSELRALLRQTLPDYMLPYHFVQLPALPLTPNGKVDRRQLSSAALEVAPAGLAVASAETVSTIEAALIGLFSRALGRPVARDTDFFDAGGDSLGVLRVVALLSQEQGLALTSGELFLHSTPRRLAQRLDRLSAGAARPRHLLLLRQGASRESIVLAHPVGGHLAPYGRLMRHLDSSITLYGLQSTPDSKESYASLRERCSAYVAEVVAACRGSLILAGYSLGGAIALEMADQLRRAGCVVPLVLLLDAAVPRLPRRGIEKLRHRISELRRFSWTDRRIWLAEQLARRLHLVSEEPSQLSEAEALMDVPGMELLIHQAQCWQPPQYAGRVFLFRGERNLRGYLNPAGTYGWGQHCTNLEVLSLPCNHAQILVEPQVQRIADGIQSLLADVPFKFG